MAPHLFTWTFGLLLLCYVHAFPQPRQTRRDEPAGPVWNSCGDLIREVSSSDNPSGVVYAIDVYNCWATVPFNAAVATRFLTYWNDTLQFQSTLEWLKKPPPGYQKPAVDLVAGVQEIQNKVTTGQYDSQYDFEADVQRLVFSANDIHFYLLGGLLSSFKFANNYGLTTLSLDGVALPKVYTTYDLYLNQSQGSQVTWQPSAITQINGQDAIEYLSEFAVLNSLGTLEPHADWNTLMDNPALDVNYEMSNFQGYATFYPGDEFTFSFENRSHVTDKWYAFYNNPGDTGPLETGGDFYNFFVLGFYPASYIPQNFTVDTSSDDLPVITSLANLSSAYPEKADIYQANLTVTGFTTGYFYPESSLAVLSIPTFVMINESIEAFSDAVQQFIDQAKAKGLQKVVIDLQENPGGDVLLAYNTFKQFFPSITPYGGSNRRDTQLGDLLGSVITGYCRTVNQTEEDYYTCAADEWDALVVADAATGQKFTSWSDLSGPVSDGVENVSLTQRLDIQDHTYDYANLGYWEPPSPLFQTSGANPWAASDIIILSDALCASACSMFLEFMRFDAGVRNVVVGGRPDAGPMQTPSLSRGTRFYSVFELDTDIFNAVTIDPSVAVPDRSDNSFWIEWAGVNLRNQIGLDSQIPYEMQYQAADCRIYLTPNTFNNFTNLWHYAADAIWITPEKCVSGSTGHGPSTNPTSAPPPTIPPGVSYDPNGILSANNGTSKNILLHANGDAPQPDALLTISVPRFRYTDPTVDTPPNLAGTKGSQTKQKTHQQTEQEEESAVCKLYSSERASSQCSKRRKREVAGLNPSERESWSAVRGRKKRSIRAGLSRRISD